MSSLGSSVNSGGGDSPEEEAAVGEVLASFDDIHTLRATDDLNALEVMVEEQIKYLRSYAEKKGLTLPEPRSAVLAGLAAASSIGTPSTLKDGTLKDVLGGVPGPPRLQWQNWGKTIPFQKAFKTDFMHPKTAEEVSIIVKKAVDDSKRVRCIGHGHSWTPVAFGEADQAVVLFSSNLEIAGHPQTRIMMVEKADVGKPARIKVAAGVTTGELADWLEANAVAAGHVGLPADVILNTVRYAGIIACACHGTYTDGRTVPDLVSGMTLVDCKGEIVSYTNDNEDWARLKPVLSASLGMTGVIIDITLTLDDNLTHPYVDVKHSFRPMKDVFGEKGGPEGPSRLKELVEGAVATELFWFPLNSMSMAKLGDFSSDKFLSDWDPWSDVMWLNMFDKRVKANPSLPVQKYAEENDHRRRELRETQFGTWLNYVGQKLPGRGTKIPLRFQALAGVLPMYVLPMEAESGYLKSGTKTLMRAIHYQQCIDEFTCYDFEMCVPVADDFSNVYKMWAAVVDILENTVRTEFTNPLNVAMEMRFTRGTCTTISPAHVPPEGKQDQLFCWIEVLGGTGTPLRKSWIPFCKKVFDAWTSIDHPGSARPKPHWAKWVDIGLANKLDPPGGNDPSMEDWLTPYVKEVYEEQLREFASTLQELDPDGVFRCRWVSDLLPKPKE